MLHTNMLYWGLKLSLKIQIIERILTETSAYPEGWVSF